MVRLVRSAPPVVVVALLALGLTACTSDDKKPAAITSSSPSRAALDATGVARKFEAAGLPVTNIQTQDENTDPNSLLGRPGQYTSRASFDVPGGDPEVDAGDIDRGGVIEVFADRDAAKRRHDYLKAISDSAGPFVQYLYLDPSGKILVRIAGKVTPTVAKQFEDVTAKL